MYYVTMNDIYKSYWGLSKDKINKLIFECATREDAEYIINYVKNNRPEMKYIYVCRKKPTYRKKKYYVQYINKYQFINWRKGCEK